jgi:malonate transporter and related proteins
MLAILAIMAPVFGIIALGYLAGRIGYLSDATANGIAEFAFKIAIPAVLFRTILLAKFEGVAPLGILASFFGSAALVWLLSIAVTRFVLARPAADGPAIAMSSVFGNTIMLGLPIGVATLGPDVLAPISVIIAVHAPVFLLSATLHSAVAGPRDGQPLAAAVGGVFRQLSRQPIVVAIACAGLWRLSGVPAPEPLLALVEMLAKAGVPAALVALGLSLRTFVVKGDAATLSAMLVLKLLVLPLFAAALAVGLGLPKMSAEAVVLTAALPAGANAYLFSVQSGRATNSSSGAVALGTAISAVTLAALIAGFRGAL